MKLVIVIMQLLAALINKIPMRKHRCLPEEE